MGKRTTYMVLEYITLIIAFVFMFIWVITTAVPWIKNEGIFAVGTVPQIMSALLLNPYFIIMIVCFFLTMIFYLLRGSITSENELIGG